MTYPKGVNPKDLRVIVPEEHSEVDLRPTPSVW